MRRIEFSGRAGLALVFAWCLLMGLAVPVLAQTGSADGGGDSAVASEATVAEENVAEEIKADESATKVGAKQSWRDVVRNGGFLMYVLGGMSVMTVAFVVYFGVVLRVSQVAPRALRRELVEKIKTGAYDDASRACDYKPCPLADVAQVAIAHVRTIPDLDPSILRDTVEGEGARQAEAIQGQTQYLLDIAVVSPMVGLLGTVFGMLRAFGAVATDIASAKPVLLAEGVSQALVTTAFGLIVGIPAMVCYAWFRRRASNVVSVLEAASTDLLIALLSKRVK